MLSMKTTLPPLLAPQWIILDARDQSVGRIAVTAATILRGKHRSQFSPHRLYGDHVIVVNASAVEVHPAKKSQKLYRHHTGYLGHMRVERLDDMLRTNPIKVIEKAVWGMLPKNRLRARARARLHVFSGVDHPFSAQKPCVLTTRISRGMRMSPLS